MSGAAGGMKVQSLNGVKVYTVSGQRTFASWVTHSKQRSLRKDDEYLRRLDLVQDLQFDTAATRMKSTPDQNFLIASGIYPPQVKVYELSELSLKFERHLTSEIIDFQVLGDDYSKLAFLCADRSVCLHAKFGSYFSTRIPRMGRDLAYDRWSCDLLLAASSYEVYRLNLEQGRFLAPLLTRSSGINVIGQSSIHGLIACGGEDGALECFDVRQKEPVGRIDVVGPTGNCDQEVTALRFDEIEGMHIAVGTRSGQVLVYDLRSSTPLYIKDHMYGSAILDIKWHESISTLSRQLITTDSRVLRIWNPQTGEGMVNVEAPVGEINDVCVCQNSGLIFMALDSPRISSYFIPALGPAPKWCSYLENLTEEMEETAQTTIYDDFKFVTKEDLERLNLTNLLGTNLLRAYMHGFFLDHRLYTKAKALTDPFAYEEFREKRIQEKMDAERAARITVRRKLPKVNKQLAARILASSNGNDIDGADEDETISPKQGPHNKRTKAGLSLLRDQRFSSMFSDEAFEVDENAPEFRALHPNKEKNKVSLMREHFDLVDESENESAEERSGSSGSSSSETEGEQMSSSPRKQNKLGTKQRQQGAMISSGPRLYMAKDEVHAEAFRSRVSLAEKQKLSLEERMVEVEGSKILVQPNSKVRGIGGSRQISFNPKGSLVDGDKPVTMRKRGIEPLRLEKGHGKGSYRGKGRGMGLRRTRGSSRGGARG